MLLKVGRFPDYISNLLNLKLTTWGHGNLQLTFQVIFVYSEEQGILLDSKSFKLQFMLFAFK